MVDYLRADGNVSLIGLWGRSMGAVTRFCSFTYISMLSLHFLNADGGDLSILASKVKKANKDQFSIFSVTWNCYVIRESLVHVVLAVP